MFCKRGEGQGLLLEICTSIKKRREFCEILTNAHRPITIGIESQDKI